MDEKELQQRIEELEAQNKELMTKVSSLEEDIKLAEEMTDFRRKRIKQLENGLKAIQSTIAAVL